LKQQTTWICKSVEKLETHMFTSFGAATDVALYEDYGGDSVGLPLGQEEHY